MVQNVIELSEKDDKVINIVKALHGLKTKSEAIALITQNYADNFLELEIRPEYLKKLERIEKEEGIPFKNIGELREIIEGEDEGL